MRTAIHAGWLVAFIGGEHRLVRNGLCVIESDRIEYAGPNRDVSADMVIDASGSLVSPGLISTHTHVAVNAAEVLFRDRRRPDIATRNYMNWLASVRDRPRVSPDSGLGALFGMAQCLRGGATTVVDFGSAADPAGFRAAVETLGIRAYTGLSFRDALVRSQDDGRLDYDWDVGRARAGLQDAVASAEQLDGLCNDRLRAILCPGHPDLIELDVLAEAAAIAAARSWPVAVHASIDAPAFRRTMDRYRRTPVRLLEEAGLLSTNTIVCHSVFVDSHSFIQHVEAEDIETLGRYRATVSHAPVKYQHMGVVLESFQRYVDAGINMTIGTDFSPRSIIDEMRAAMLMSRVADRSFLSTEPRMVFDAATINAARALGRDDIGRLSEGAKADVLVVDLATLQVGATRDPIASLVESSSARDIRTIFVDGAVVLADGRLTSVSEDGLLARVQDEAQRLWADVPNWIWGHATVDELAPRAYASPNIGE